MTLRVLKYNENYRLAYVTESKLRIFLFLKFNKAIVNGLREIP